MGKGQKPQGKRGKSKPSHKGPQKAKKHSSEDRPSRKPESAPAPTSDVKASSKMKQKISQKQHKSKPMQLQLDPKLKNKNHQQKAKNWKDSSAAAKKGPQTSEDEQRSLLRKTYNNVMENAKDPTKAQEFVEKCLKIMGDGAAKFGFKRDGSHIIQACITYGSADQIERVKKMCKAEFYKLMQDKYGRFLAKKLYDTAFDDLEKKAVLEHLCTNMEKYMLHMYATDLIEHLFVKGKTAVKEKIFEATFGAKLKFLKATENLPEAGTTDINKIFAEHPLIKDQIMDKLAQQIDTCVLKGLIRLNFIQKLVLFYLKNATQEAIEKLLEEAHKNYLALLGSRDGMYAACILFTAANQKLRKHMVKQLRTETENLVDNMLTNHLGTVFLLKILFTMDDTKLSCKVILDRALELLPDSLENQVALRMLSAVCSENVKRYYANDDCEILSYTRYTTSKKSEGQRKEEVTEHLLEGLQEKLPSMIPENLGNKGFGDLLTEALSYAVKGRYVQYQELVKAFIGAIEDGEKAGEQLVVDIIKRVVEEELKPEKEPEADKKEESAEEKVTQKALKKGTEFSDEICRIVIANFEKLLQSKGVFAVNKLLQFERTRSKLHETVMKYAAKVEELAKASEKSKGLQLIATYIKDHHKSQ